MEVIGAIVLIGIASFFVVLFILVNHQDKNGHRGARKRGRDTASTALTGGTVYSDGGGGGSNDGGGGGGGGGCD